jgi:transposase
MRTRRQLSREFKLEAVKLVKDRGVTAKQAARDLDVHENVLRKWVRREHHASMEYEPEEWIVFPMGCEPEMRFLDRSSQHGDRYERCETRHSRAAARVFGRRSRPRPHRNRQRSDSLRLYQECAQAVQVSTAEQGTAGLDPPLSAAGDGLFAPTAHAFDRPVPAERSPGAALPSHHDVLRSQVHHGRHRAARRARQPARHALRPSHPGVAAARLPPLWPGLL